MAVCPELSLAQNEAFSTRHEIAYLTDHFTTMRKKINKSLHFGGFPIYFTSGNVQESQKKSNRFDCTSIRRQQNHGDLKV